MNISWQTKLDTREANQSLRQLKVIPPFTDFSSNDYLGFAHHDVFQQRLLDSISLQKRSLTSATGSRLISGNQELLTNTESLIANLHRYEDCLLLESGYQANLALFSCLLGRHDTYIVDEYIHRSVHDGCRLSDAKKWKFRHNDLEHLESLLQKATGDIVVAVESLYSMDGDWAPLTDLVMLTRRYRAKLIVDEAHALGVKGLGLVDELCLQKQVFATVKTYGKAMGVHGGAVLCLASLKAYLVNFAAPFIYTTAPSGIMAMSICESYNHLKQHPHFVEKLERNIQFFIEKYQGNVKNIGSPIQIILKSEIHQYDALVEELFDNQFQTYLVNAPTVTKGKERIRICIHADHTEQQILRLCTIFNHYL